LIKDARFTLGKLKKVLIFKEHFRSGGVIEIKKDITCFKKSGYYFFIDKIPSIIIGDDTESSEGCIWLFNDYCFGGERVEICKKY
jgi:hypothetical protein